MAITTLFLTGVEISARMYRGLVSDLFAEGIRNVPAGEYLVTPRPSGANMTVQIATGVAYIQGDDVTGQGVYRVENDALIIDVPIAAAPASGTRTDLVCLRVQDKQAIGGTANVGSIVVLTGQATLSASDKTLIALASVSVAAGQTSVQTANITDLRLPSTGGGAAVRTAAETLTTSQIAALTTAQKYDGRLVLNSSTGKLQRAFGGVFGDVSPVKAQGIYTGNGAATRTVTIGFPADLVLVSAQEAAGIARFAWFHRTETAAIQSLTAFSSGTTWAPGNALTSNGFVTASTSESVNVQNVTYYWTAWKLS